MTGTFARRPTRRQPVAPPTNRGFTLIELGVTLAIIAMVVGLVAISIANIRRAELRQTSGIMAAAMRYIYNLAVINQTPYRLVIDMDESVFWAEELDSDDPCQRYLPDEEADDDGPRRLRGGGRSKRGGDGKGRSGGEDDEETAGQEADLGGSGYVKRKDNLLSRRELPEGIRVTGVITSHHQTTQEQGTVAIHFFPGGYCERAYIWLGEVEGQESEARVETLATVELDGLMGRVTKHPDVLEEADFLREQE